MKSTKVIHGKNGGLSDARNAGIVIAQGEFLLFVDSDDYIEKDLCESCMNVMDEDIDIVAFNYGIYIHTMKIRKNVVCLKNFPI
ncbi:MAG: glycosyltransferase [Ruminococcus sp.]